MKKFSQRKEDAAELYCQKMTSDDEILRAIANNTGNTPPSATWSKPKGNQPYTEHPGLPTNLCLSMRNAYPSDFFKLMVPDSLLQEIADRANLFAINKIARSVEISRFARLRKWVRTNLGEIKKKKI